MIPLISLFPIGDDNEGRTIQPYVTYILIAINIAVFVLLQGLGSNDAFTNGYSVVPKEIVTNQDFYERVQVEGGVLGLTQGPQPIYLTILSAMFMHGSLMHLGGNLLYLWIFGDNLEDAMGHFKFLLFYIVCGVLATAAHILVGPTSMIPSLGASGAIAGVLGGYLLLFPGRQVRVLIGYMGIVALPALIVIGLWGALQFLNGFGELASPRNGGGVAYMAHVGGFVAGLILVNLFRNRNTQQRVQHRIEAPVDYFPLGGGRK